MQGHRGGRGVGFDGHPRPCIPKGCKRGEVPPPNHNPCIPSGWGQLLCRRAPTPTAPTTHCHRKGSCPNPSSPFDGMGRGPHSSRPCIPSIPLGWKGCKRGKGDSVKRVSLGMVKRVSLGMVKRVSLGMAQLLTWLFGLTMGLTNKIEKG
ncbi:hypothetical protein COCOBI_pt-1270 (chloroplast) [Coccomyxa sp. Obi]|nr:hypothetical protein COCOBI_pt-1270 [Coccomyxa sp. Obi]